MLQGILNAGIKNNIIATDIKDRGNITNIEIKTGSEFDLFQIIILFKILIILL